MPCVLIVDDEPLIRWSMSETLIQAGYQVMEAVNARETLECLATRPAPDVILLDYRLPDTKELDLLERVRRAAPSSPVIMMTAYGTPAMQSAALALGAWRVVSKPLEMRGLAPLLQEARASRTS